MRPIKTAPKDGTTVLVSGGNMGVFCPTFASAQYDDGEWHLDQYEAPEEKIEPTLWAPLPEPQK